MQQLLAALILIATLGGAQTVHADSVDQLASELGLSADERARLARGEVVTREPASSNSRELAIGLAIQSPRPPGEVARELLDGVALREDPDVLARGPISKGALSEFAGVALDGSDAASAYLAAAPGETLNLSTAEIAAFQKLAADPAATAAPKDAVERLLRGQLLTRYQAYAAGGLGAIAPYARGSREERPGEDLLAATRASRFFAAHAPRMLGVLTDYPKTRPADLREHYQWLVYDAHGSRVFVLGHFVGLQDGDAWSVAARHFYVSGTYNAEQNLALLIPTDGGGTLGLVLTRVSTDQVAGFGGSAKRSIGERLMAKTLSALAERSRGAAQKQ